MGWVLDHSPAKGTERLVLLSLANHAGKSPTGDAWEAYPGIDTIQREARLDRRRTAQEALSRCIANGHIERAVNGAPDGRIPANRRPNLYRILLAQGVPCGVTPCGWCGVPDGGTPDPPSAVPDGGTPEPGPGVPHRDTQGCRLRTVGVPPDDTQGCRGTAPKPSENRFEPSVEPKTLALDVIEGDHVPTFDDFWALYPKRVGKGDARKAWDAAVKRSKPSDILAGLARYVDETSSWPTEERKYIPGGGPWLRADRWWDEPGVNRRGRATAGRQIQTDRSAPSGRIDPKDL